MNNIKSFSVINYDKLKGDIHVLGCGAIGSKVITELVRLNLGSKIIAYDFDLVEGKNINNQAYLNQHIGMKKTDAIKNLCKLIDPEFPIRVVDKEVKSLSNDPDDIVIICLDNYDARVNVLKSLRGDPLVVIGGANKAGGNVEVVKGDYSALIKEYGQLESGNEYDEQDLTPCGSPISISHRIQTIANIICEQVVKYNDTKESINKNLVFSLPDYFFVME